MKTRIGYAFILARHDKDWTVKVMCGTLGVSVSGYYKHKKNLGRPGKDERITAAIKGIFDESIHNDNYGVPRIKLALARRGVEVGTRRITRLMRANGWLHKPKRRPKGLTRATTEVQGSENLIKQNFSSDEPLRKILTDITQIRCLDGPLYISPTPGWRDGEILSPVMRDNMKKELCIDTFKALASRYRVEGAVLHSDRGNRYTGDAFRSALAEAGVIQSLSGVHHCFDNARMESFFFATLKKELLYRIPVSRMTGEKVKSQVFRYVFTYYNRQRVCTTNPGGFPPVIYRQMSGAERMEEGCRFAAV